MRTLFKLLSVAASLIPGLLGVRYGVQRRMLKSAERQGSSPNGISSAEPVTIGGVRQWILIQGENVAKLVFLILHGGPGMPFPGVAYRIRSPLAVKNSELAKRFVLVKGRSIADGR